VFGLAAAMDRGVQVENSGSFVFLSFHSSVSSRFCMLNLLIIFTFLICSIQGPTTCTFLMYSYSSLVLLYMFRVLFASILRSTIAAYSHRYVYGFDMLAHWSRYWLGHSHTFSTANFGHQLRSVGEAAISLQH
jgi:hypothetical protein